MDFSERLKELRKAENISQAEMAKNIGIAQSVYARYETGLKKPAYENLLKIAEFFGVTTDYLLGNISGDIAAASSDTGYDLPPEALVELEQYKEFLRQKYGKKD